MNDHEWDLIARMCRKCGLSEMACEEQGRPPCALADDDAPYEHVACARAKSELRRLIGPAFDRLLGSGVPMQ